MFFRAMFEQMSRASRASPGSFSARACSISESMVTIVRNITVLPRHYMVGCSIMYAKNYAVICRCKFIAKKKNLIARCLRPLTCN